MDFRTDWSCHPKIVLALIRPTKSVTQSAPPELHYQKELSWEKFAAEAAYRPNRLAALCNVSLRTLQRHFRSNYQVTLTAWLRPLRLQKAYEQIRSGSSVKAVAYNLGFKQVSHFSRVFKQAHGLPPTFLGGRVTPLARLLSTKLPHIPPPERLWVPSTPAPCVSKTAAPVSAPLRSFAKA